MQLSSIFLPGMFELDIKPAQEWIVQIERIQFHKCELCTKAFITSDDLIAHNKVHEKFLEHALSCYVKIEKVDILSCIKCRQGFLSHSKLLLHRVKHARQSVADTIKQQARLQYNNEDIAKLYQCPECDYKFVVQSTLEAHSIVHQPHPHVCYCGIGYYKELDLKRHIKLVQCKPKIKEMEIATEKPNGSFKPARNKLKENVPIKKEQVKLPILKTDMTKTSHVKVKRGSNLVLPPLDVEFKRDHLLRWVCPKCLKSFGTKSDAQLHYRAIHRGERPHHCNICAKSFTQSHAVKKHIQNIHIGKRNFECEYCDKKFKSIEQQIRHERIHTGYKPYRCTFCEKAFSDPSAHARHERIHTGDKRYKCPYCPKAYTDNSALYVHKKRHLNQRDFKCNECLKKFYNLTDLKRHMNYAHIKEYKYTCDYCKRDFYFKKYLTRHIKTVHSGKNTCKYCFARFVSKARLWMHLKVHSNKRKFECDLCHRRYNTKTVLTGHIIKVHLRCSCKECGRHFTAMSDLKKHKLSVSERCDICDKELFCKGGLSSHFKVHV